MNRHQSRENAMIVIYQYLLLGSDIEELKDNFSEYENRDFFNLLINNVVYNLSVLKEEISTYLTDWDFDRLNYVEQAILLIATCELRLQEVERAIVIDEAINLCKKFSDEESYRYINGVLDKL
jgi:transcription antitermination factor NusB